ncbi:MAG: hypothetical protein IT463_11720 [Planctomycetes bacterium]|nr:hypothetical protein [Planctomycetota bacterium]
MALIMLACSAVGVWAGTAAGESKPSGGVSGVSYKDKNGKMELEFGAASTWAAARGNISNKHDVTAHPPGQPDLKKSASGGATDRTVFSGMIMETEAPLWTGLLTAKMQVGAGAYTSLNFNRKIEAKATGVIAAWGDAAGLPRVAAAEVLTTNQQQPGKYDLTVDVGGTPMTVVGGGRHARPTTDIGPPGGHWTWISAHPWFLARFNNQIQFTYESRASGSMEIDFLTKGKETADFTVEQEFQGAWRGLVLAWEVAPQFKLLRAFSLK